MAENVVFEGDEGEGEVKFIIVQGVSNLARDTSCSRRCLMNWCSIVFCS